ncbi:UvrD-helicase domain-containing protein [Lacrimispora brassicae]
MDYNSLHILDENRTKEENVFKEIVRCIDANKSFVFDAGAGAGKTYALVQSLKHILVRYGTELKLHKQKALCITFTNVAAKEIKERLGNTNLIEVSTIHNWAWDIISPYQKQLVEIHLDKLKAEVGLIQINLDNEKWAEQYIKLLDHEKELLTSMLLKKKGTYYKYKGGSASDFKAAFLDINEAFPLILKNVGNFKKIIDNLFKMSSYNISIEKIEAQDDKYKKIKYDARFNNDRLAAMLISHETLLEYVEKIIENNNILKQIIFDQYPYILVDEYQDTDPKVVNTLSRIETYSKVVNHKCIIGYYGDKKQNIYDKGVGDSFSKYHSGLERIKKEFNRRSASEIIAISNSVRNDDLLQETIYSDFPAGSVSFYNLEMEREHFIKAHIERWNITKENKLHCFELTNERVAEFSGFGNIYNFFKDSVWYKQGKRYEMLRDHILSLDTTKLGIVQNLLFRILDFKHKIILDDTMILDVIPFGKKVDEIDITMLRQLISKLTNITGQTLKTYTINLFENYKCGDRNYDKCVAYIIGEKISSFQEFESFILDQLYISDNEENSTDDEIARYKFEVDKFLEIDMNFFYLWYKFLIDKSDGNVVYHTYHGTKGREFDNVIIFMNSKFGRDNYYFDRLLKVISEKSETNGNNDEKTEEARNLLYVAITRAIKNLSILYFDNLNGNDEQVSRVFGEIKNALS